MDKDDALFKSYKSKFTSHPLFFLLLPRFFLVQVIVLNQFIGPALFKRAVVAVGEQGKATHASIITRSLSNGEDGGGGGRPKLIFDSDHSILTKQNKTKTLDISICVVCNV